MAFEEVKEVMPKYWKPEEIGECIEGNVFRFEAGQYGKQIVLDMGDDEDGNIMETTLPAHKQLQNFIPRLDVGDYIKVELVEIKPSTVEGRNPTKIYKVLKDPEQAVDYGE